MIFPTLLHSVLIFTTIQGKSQWNTKVQIVLFISWFALLHSGVLIDCSGRKCPITECIRNKANQKWIQISLQTCRIPEQVFGSCCSHVQTVCLYWGVIRLSTTQVKELQMKIFHMNKFPTKLTFITYAGFGYKMDEILSLTDNQFLSIW